MAPSFSCARWIHCASAVASCATVAPATESQLIARTTRGLSRKERSFPMSTSTRLVQVDSYPGARRPNLASGGDGDHLGLKIFLEALEAVLPAHAALLVAAERPRHVE